MSAHIEIMLETSFPTTPRLRSLRLTDVGVWASAQLAFSPRLNVIVGDGGTGKSTILRSIVTALGRAVPHAPTTHEGASAARIELTVDPELPCSLSEYPLPPDLARASAGERMIAGLKRAVEGAGAGRAVLFDGEVFGRLDVTHAEQAVACLAGAKCQVVGVFGFHTGVELPSGTKLFTCGLADDGSTARVESTVVP